MSNLFLGLDLSTQSLSCVLIDIKKRKVLYETSLNFDTALPKFKTKHGVLKHANPHVKHTPPLLWVSALDLLFAKMKKDKVPLKEIIAISGSGQQHGSVYLNSKAEKILQNLNSQKSLKENLESVFSRKTSPIWMDSSTTKECEEIRKKLGGMKKTIRLTGSDTFERFTGPQIRKFYKTNPKAYEKTSHIALVSSFMASLIAGKIAPLDYGDGAGMNLMDIHKKTWSKKALLATAPKLEKKLPPLQPAGKVLGKVSSYFVKKYGLNPNALATVWTGDNPASVVGLGLTKPGQIAISLGTSDTFFGTMTKCHTDPNGEGHVFGSPLGGYMTLLCFKNGSLAREKIKEHYHIANWKKFGLLVKSIPIGNNGGILLPWFEVEIVPRTHKKGIHRFDLDEKDAASHCRAILEAQMLSMRLHSKWMQVRPKEILATGGASKDTTLLQVMADVMQCKVARIEVSKSTALGAALLAAYGYLSYDGKHPKWNTLTQGFTKKLKVIKPNKKAAKIYDALLEKYKECESLFLVRK